ncbi:MAG: hypothetical protein ACRC5A_05445 [Enterobacteriaceae bacterium]
MRAMTVIEAADLLASLATYTEAGLLLLGDTNPEAKSIGCELLTLVQQKAAEAARNMQGVSDER